MVEQNCMQIPIYWRGAAAVCVRFEKVMAAPKGTVCVSRWASTRNSHLAKSSFWHAGCRIHACLYQGSVTRDTRQGSLVRKHTLAASVVTAARSFLWSVCVRWLWGCWWLGLFSMIVISQFLLSRHPYCALGLPGQNTQPWEAELPPGNKNWWLEVCFWRIALLHVNEDWGL